MAKPFRRNSRRTDRHPSAEHQRHAGRAAQSLGSEQSASGFELLDRGNHDAGVELIYLEEVRQNISDADRFFALLRRTLNPRPPTDNLQPHDTAVVLFTS